jgi:uncharacterized membrane protein YhiD involved in acid resistance
VLKIKAKLDHYTAPIKVTSAIVSVVSFAGGVTTGVLAAITPVASCAFPPLAILAVGLILVAAVALLFVFILSRCIQSKDASPKINNPKLQENDISRETDADNENEEENEREVSENNESHLSQSLDAQKSVSDMLKENYAKFLKKEKILQEKSKEISEIHSNLGDRSPVIDSSLTPPPPSPPLSPPPEDRQSEVSQAKRSFPKTFYRDFFFKRLAKKISASNMIKLEETNHTEAPEKEETLPLKIE